MREYWFVYKENLDKICANCVFCDESMLNINRADEDYQGYDGGAWCRAYNASTAKRVNDMVISPSWKKCSLFMKNTTEWYINEFAYHILYALAENRKDPERTIGKTRSDIVSNVVKLYKKTVKMFTSEKSIEYCPELFNKHIDNYYKYKIESMNPYYKDFWEYFRIKVNF